MSTFQIAFTSIFVIVALIVFGINIEKHVQGRDTSFSSIWFVLFLAAMVNHIPNP